MKNKNYKIRDIFKVYFTFVKKFACFHSLKIMTNCKHENSEVLKSREIKYTKFASVLTVFDSFLAKIR